MSAKRSHRLYFSDLDKLWPCQALVRKEEISDAESQDRAWAWIDHAFSEPISSSDASCEYVPTQIIAEIFKAAGYDGIKYRSSVASGYNVAVFDVTAAEVLETELYYTNDIRYEFSEKQFPK